MKTAFVLTSGNVAGAFQVGAIKKLADKGVMPDVIISTSVGSINGARLACGGDFIENLAALEKCWLAADEKEYFPKNSAGKLPFYSIEGIRNILHKHLPARDFKQLKVPLYIRAIRAHDNKTIFFNSGNLIDSILASCSVYPLFKSYNLKGIEYKDGFNGKETEIEQAIKLGCTRIFLIDSSGGLITNFFRALDILKKSNRVNKKKIKEFKGDLIEIRLPKRMAYLSKGFRHARMLIKEGEKQAEKALRKTRN